MKRTVTLVLIFISLASCQQRIEQEDIKMINGYWEIEKVVFPDGELKEYTINETVDHFEFAGNSGYRKKMKPQFDGKYLVNDHAEKVRIIIGEKSYLEYSTEFDKWKEEIIELTSERLVLKNERGAEYHYRRPIPFSIK